jgi:hypothetical protein
MNELWKTFSSIVPIGAGNVFSSRSAEPLDGWALWPPTLTSSSWAPAILPISSVPPEGLLASLGTGTSGGILGSLAPPWKHFGPSVGVLAPPPAGAASRPPPGIDQYPSPVPRVPRWEDVLTREFADSAQTLLGPPSRSSPGALAGDHNTGDWSDRHADGDPKIISDASPDNEWILNAQYAAEGHHHNPRAVLKSSRFRQRPARYLKRPPWGRFQFVGGMRTMLSIAHTARLLENSWTGLCRMTASSPNK